MPKQRLDRADVVAAFEEMRGEGMPEGMGGDAFFDAGEFDSAANRSLNGMRSEMMTPDHACAGIR